jgi:hypothetical protein
VSERREEQMAAIVNFCRSWSDPYLGAWLGLSFTSQRAWYNNITQGSSLNTRR